MLYVRKSFAKDEFLIELYRNNDGIDLWVVELSHNYFLVSKGNDVRFVFINIVGILVQQVKVSVLHLMFILSLFF